MKIFKYVTMLVAALAMTTTFSSCDKEVDPDVDAKQNYWMELTLSNPGSLSAAAQATFNNLVEEVVYGGGDHFAIYNTESYARNNFNAVVESMTPSSDFAQHVVLPTALVDRTRDFEFTFTLSRQDGENKTQLDSHVFRAADLVSDEDIRPQP